MQLYLAQVVVAVVALVVAILMVEETAEAVVA
jgi:hypothetical protein